MPSFKINEKAISWSNMQYAEDIETDKKLFSVSRISRFTSNTWKCDYAVCLGESSNRVWFFDHMSVRCVCFVLQRQYEGSMLHKCYQKAANVLVHGLQDPEALL